MENLDIVMFEKVLKDEYNSKFVHLSSSMVLTPLDKELANTVKRASMVIHTLESISTLTLTHGEGDGQVCAVCTVGSARPKLEAAISAVQEVANMEVLPKVLW